MAERQVLLSNRGKGKELQELLRRALGIPEGVIEFSVHFAVAQAVRVECSFYPKEDKEPASG